MGVPLSLCLNPHPKTIVKLRNVFHETPKKTKRLTIHTINHLAIIFQVLKLNG